MDAMEFTKWDTIQVLIWTSKHKRVAHKTKKRILGKINVTCIIFLTWLMKWAFFLFLLINQSAKKLPVLFNKDKVEVNSRLCRSQIWSLSVYYKWVLSQRVFIIFLNTSFAHTVRTIKISWTLFPLVFLWPPLSVIIIDQYQFL